MRAEGTIDKVGANTGVLSQTSIPFGGVKQSGFGREGTFSSSLTCLESSTGH
jgi:acyl-CoA reductase-like NAD-dependent aldehyde dehydrogenase